MENDKEIDMKRDSSDFGVPDMSGLEQAYNESLERLGLTEKMRLLKRTADRKKFRMMFMRRCWKRSQSVVKSIKASGLMNL